MRKPILQGGEGRMGKRATLHHPFLQETRREQLFRGHAGRADKSGRTAHENGVLIAILPASAEVGSTGKHERFQAWAESKRQRYGRLWTDLPAESFASLGVRINTVVLQLTRWG